MHDIDAETLHSADGDPPATRIEEGTRVQQESGTETATAAAILEQQYQNENQEQNHFLWREYELWCPHMHCRFTEKFSPDFLQFTTTAKWNNEQQRRQFKLPWCVCLGFQVLNSFLVLEIVCPRSAVRNNGFIMYFKVCVFLCTTVHKSSHSPLRIRPVHRRLQNVCNSDDRLVVISVVRVRIDGLTGSMWAQKNWDVKRPINSSTG